MSIGLQEDSCLLENSFTFALVILSRLKELTMILTNHSKGLYLDIQILSMFSTAFQWTCCLASTAVLIPILDNDMCYIYLP